MITKSPKLAAFVMIFCVGALMSGALASKELNTEKTEPVYEELARFKYGAASVGGIGLARCPTGFTLVSLDSGADATRFAISAAFRKTAPHSAYLRVRATDKDGRVFEPTKKSQASGSGSSLGVTTMVCEFDMGEDAIDMLIVERRMKHKSRKKQ